MNPTIIDLNLLLIEHFIKVINENALTEKKDLDPTKFTIEALKEVDGKQQAFFVYADYQVLPPTTFKWVKGPIASLIKRVQDDNSPFGFKIINEKPVLILPFGSKADDIRDSVLAEFDNCECSVDESNSIVNIDSLPYSGDVNVVVETLTEAVSDISVNTSDDPVTGKKVVNVLFDKKYPFDENELLLSIVYDGKVKTVHSYVFSSNNTYEIPTTMLEEGEHTVEVRLTNSKKVGTAKFVIEAPKKEPAPATNKNSNPNDGNKSKQKSGKLNEVIKESKNSQ